MSEHEPPGHEPEWEPTWDSEPEPEPAPEPPLEPSVADTELLAARPRSHRAPPGAQLGRVLGPVVALVVVVVVVVLLIWINGRPNGSLSEAATGGSPSVTTTPSHSPSMSPSPSPSTSTSPSSSTSPSAKTSIPVAGGPTTGGSSPSPPSKPASRTAKAPVQVLNNSRITGLAHQVAADIEGKGWHVVVVGNLRGVISESTVYYSAGDRTAAKHLANEFPEVRRIEPNSAAGLTQVGITLVITSDWVS